MINKVVLILPHYPYSVPDVDNSIHNLSGDI